MKDVMIRFDGDRDRLTLHPEFLPAPKADLRRVLRYAERTGEISDVVQGLLENADDWIERCETGREIYDEEQRKTLGLLQDAHGKRDAARALCKKEKDPEARKIIRANILELSERIRALGDARRSGLRAKIDYERRIRALKGNKEVLETWQTPQQ